MSRLLTAPVGRGAAETPRGLETGAARPGKPQTCAYGGVGPPGAPFSRLRAALSRGPDGVGASGDMTDWVVSVPVATARVLDLREQSGVE